MVLYGKAINNNRDRIWYSQPCGNKYQLLLRLTDISGMSTNKMGRLSEEKGDINVSSCKGGRIDPSTLGMHGNFTTEQLRMGRMGWSRNAGYHNMRFSWGTSMIFGWIWGLPCLQTKQSGCNFEIVPISSQGIKLFDVLQPLAAYLSYIFPPRNR